MTTMFEEPPMLLVNFQNQILTSIQNIYDSLMKGEIKRFFYHVQYSSNMFSIVKGGWEDDQTILNC